MTLVERLRAPVPRAVKWVMHDYPDGRSEGPFDPVRLEAADEIERLEKALETAREALEPFGPLARVILSEAPPEVTYANLFLDCQGISHRITLDALRDVQRTLAQKKED